MPFIFFSFKILVHWPILLDEEEEEFNIFGSLYYIVIPCLRSLVTTFFSTLSKELPEEFLEGSGVQYNVKYNANYI